MTESERQRFDALLEDVIESLPEGIRNLLDEMPVIAEDRPEQGLLDELSKEDGVPLQPDELCGLHTGVAFTDKSVAFSGELPSEIRLFREGILAEAGGWETPGEDIEDVNDSIHDEIRITLLHEIGHQFGLDEEDLERLGYQ